MKAKPFLIGLSAGIIGSLTTILFTTPQSGQQLRTNIIGNAQNTKKNLNDVMAQTSNLKQTISTLKNEAQNNIPSIINDLKTSITNFKQDIEPQTIKLKEEIENLQNSITEIENNLTETKNEKEN